MNEKLEILLVEDDGNACNEFINEIDNIEDFSLIGITGNSDKAFKMVSDTLPDVVILDLELHCGGGDGLNFLKSLKEAQLPKTPFVLVTTNNISSVIHKAARDNGADFIMTKNQENYSAKSVLEFLKITKSAIKSNPAAEVAASEYSPTVATKRLHKLITTELNYVGINPKSKGYKYLMDAISTLSNQPVQYICIEIGKKYEKSDKSVERAMQNAIDRAWVTSDTDKLYKHYTARIGSGKGVPTLTEFIYYYVNKISNEI